MIKWNKYPTVRPGGKTYFYVAFTEDGKRSVVWDRLQELWAVTGEQEPPHGHVRTLGLFKTADKAMKFVEAGAHHQGNDCGAYAEHWAELGKPKDWSGCSLPNGHDGDHRDTIVIPKDVKCHECGGGGQIYYASDRVPLQNCFKCKGTGSLPTNGVRNK